MTVLTVTSVLCALCASLFWRARQVGRRYRVRQDALALAVRERTEELTRERLLEGERNRILEMLVANQPLGSVLDATVRLVVGQVPGASGAVLMKRKGGCRVGAAPDFPKKWLHALQALHAVPFEVWQKPFLHKDLERSPAWKIFTSQVEGAVPGAIYSAPIGAAEDALGALLLCYPPGAEPSTEYLGAVEQGRRLARLAIEHSRLYGDLHFQAHHDRLTGLPNRTLFEERLERSLNEAAALKQRLALLFIDLDGFKQINDTLSHRIGDMFLREIASRMKQAIRPGDTIARIGGDEFTVVVAGIENVAEAEEVATRVLDSIRQPMTIDGHQLIPSASAGVAIYPDDGTEPEQLQREADAAMYCAKDLGRGRLQAFAARNDTLDRARMNEELRAALRHGWFAVHYQPKVSAEGKFAGLEALVRMIHPQYGQIPPCNFIPVAEANGLIVPLGEWVLNEVCRQSADWQSRGLGQVPVAVNVSTVQISRPGFAQTVRECLVRHGVSPRSIELELTESILIGCAQGAESQMKALRAMGIRLSIDDFGTGYSSLSYLHRLSVDAIKLDKSFVQSIDTDELALRLVHAMIGVARGLGLGVIAEGVETERQREALVAAGCPFMQGYLFARPQPAAELETWLESHSASRASAFTATEPDDLEAMGALIGNVSLRRIEAAIPA